MGSLVKVTTKREELYKKEYKRLKLEKIKTDIDVDPACAYQLLYSLVQIKRNKVASSAYVTD